MENNTLNGFDAFFDSLNPNVGKNEDGTIESKENIDDNQSLTDEELAAELAKSNEAKLRKKGKEDNKEDDDDEEDNSDDDLNDKDKSKKDKSKQQK